MTMYPRTALSVCLGVCLLFVGCDGENNSNGDTGPDTNTAQGETASPSPGSKDPAKRGDNQNQATSGDSTDAPPPRREATSEKEGVIDSLGLLNIEEIFIRDRLVDTFEREIAEMRELPGVEPSPFYNSRRYIFENHNGFGLGIQVWAFLKPGNAMSRFQELSSQYLNVEETDLRLEGSDHSFVSERGPVTTVVSLVREPKPRIVAVSCDTSLCPEQDYFEELLDQVSERIKSTYR